MLLLDPSQIDYNRLDAVSSEIMQKTIAFFEQKGKAKLKEHDRENYWYVDFIDFAHREKIFATMLTPSGYGEDHTRWDTYRNSLYSEILGFYGLHYWYVWQVTILGLAPIFMGHNEKIKHETARLLQEGGIFGFGLSEKEHGADIYATEMALNPRPEGGYTARGGKYYIGNGNEAAFISTFGRMADTGDYVFFPVKTKHECYECVQNVVNSQSYVAEFKLHDYPVDSGEIISQGAHAWDSALNTVNIGKFGLAWASIGIATHAFHEALNHAANRRLYNQSVTDFPHVQQLFTEAYTRLAAMKLFSTRAIDYMRSASDEDRRYLLYNPIAKMKVTTEGECVVDRLWDVIAAKGFEKDMYFEMAAWDIRALPKLEGTVHVNIALVTKFMANYLFMPCEYPDIPKRHAALNDDFLFNQGAARGLGKISFHDYRLAYDLYELPNITIFKSQIDLFKTLLSEARPDAEQTKDVDFILLLGEMFTLIAYGQLILEEAKPSAVSDDLVDEIFAVMVQDFSRFALRLYAKTSATARQQELSHQLIKRPARNNAQFERFWNDEVFAWRGKYQMRP